ncbi:interferon-inducible double-stranded RNA-dependent protein kinase activator A [Aphis craccivora]|uniref:Interferon-inducible double-stranded RNA-dependent protein kinase activator A n=1 Tax=Aphis craccivora TaxID=307492 RepID=A0A6G0VSM7_APHCR|nr:interferon-inducible double-stranded RNA-dependent protein kinase activator A [Aphis craccivora]
MATLIDVGNVLLSLPVGIMIDRIGRKLSVYLTVPITLAGWILILTTRKLLIQNMLNAISIGKDCTVLVSRNVITEPLQHTDSMIEPYGLPFVNRYSLGVSWLHKIMAKHGKTVQYNILPLLFLLPYKMYTLYILCKMWGNHILRIRFQTHFLDKMASISEIDDHLGTNPPCLKSNEATNDAVSNEQGMFTNFYYGHRSNQLLTSKKKFTQKLKKYNSLDELNMRAFELLTKLTNEEVLNKPIIIILNRRKTHEETKNAAAKTALKYIKYFLKQPSVN